MLIIKKHFKFMWNRVFFDMYTLIFVVSFVITVSAKAGYGPNDQDWGYVTVRDKAHMFWWLHYTTAIDNYVERPLVIWLQGGPGGSSTGIGNFQEIGPWDLKQNERNVSWVKFLNVLFVDNPVGTGFSYVEDTSDHSIFAANNTAIAKDFVAFLRSFLSQKPEFKKVPIYIFGQSYGGKMAADIALLLNEEVKAGNIECHLKGIGLGDAWISPIDYLTTWPSYLLNLGFIDPEGYNMLKIVTDTAKDQIEAGRFEQATQYFLATQYVINSLTMVDYYNVLKKIQVENSSKKAISVESNDIRNTIQVLKELNIDDSRINWSDSQDTEEVSEDDQLLNLMKGPVTKSLNLSHIPIKWGEQSNLVFQAVNMDFMKPVIDVIETLLNTTDIEVTVYNGQLDLIVDTPGTIAWAYKLNWPGAENWKKAERTALVVDGTNEGYSKNYGNLRFYWINRSGHSVPADNPNAMEYVLQQVTKNYVNY